MLAFDLSPPRTQTPRNTKFEDLLFVHMGVFAAFANFAEKKTLEQDLQSCGSDTMVNANRLRADITWQNLEQLGGR
jgi:hypothetical protein